MDFCPRHETPGVNGVNVDARSIVTIKGYVFLTDVCCVCTLVCLESYFCSLYLAQSQYIISRKACPPNDSGGLGPIWYPTILD